MTASFHFHQCLGVVVFATVLLLTTGCRPGAPDAPANRRQSGPPVVTIASPLAIKTIDWDP